MALLTQDNLMKLFSENWTHMRHMEYYRMWSLNIYAIIMAGVLYALSIGEVEPFFSMLRGSSYSLRLSAYL